MNFLHFYCYEACGGEAVCTHVTLESMGARTELPMWHATLQNWTAKVNSCCIYIYVFWQYVATESNSVRIRRTTPCALLSHRYFWPVLFSTVFVLRCEPLLMTSNYTLCTNFLEPKFCVCEFTITSNFLFKDIINEPSSDCTSIFS